MTTGDRFRSRARLVACCAVLAGLAMVQSPGLLVADTKLDLVEGPAGFLGRTLHLWDPQAALGQLQNQAYGYLWPMGPFFLVGHAAHLPGWVVQRGWVALVMCVALVGMTKLARAFGVRSDLACLVGGFAYALSPRMLTTLGPISIEAWPGALAPWVLLPLVLGSTRGSPRRAAALSALAVAMVGGVNAAATFAVLPLGVLWILTRSAGPRRRSLMLWWPVFTLLGTFWWLVPLFVLGKYSPPFLDFIESASTTTFPATIFDSLRGTSDWVAYLDSSWRAGNDLIEKFYLPLNSGVVLFLGLVGIAQRRAPHRVFLVTGVLVGLCLVGLGHTGSVQGWFASETQSLLDGALAPLRNVHKFDPVIRVPLVLGLSLLVDALVSAPAQFFSAGRHAGVSREWVAGLNSKVLTGTAIVAVLGAALPVVAGRLTPSGGFSGIPGYWNDAAHWLATKSGGGAALLVPGSAFGNYVWGFPRDEPMQWLARSPWAVRNAVPLAPAGGIRMLDGAEQQLAQGRPSGGLAAYLSRAGISDLVVRNDLSHSAAGVPDPVLVHQALDGSPGITRVAAFGPSVGGEGSLRTHGGRVLVNGGWQSEYPALEIYEVAGSGGAVTSDRLPVVVGAPEDVLDLVNLGVIGAEPTVLAADGGRPGPGQPLILTDGYRSVERHFGRVHDGTSATLGPGDARRLGNPNPDYLLPDGGAWRSHAALSGVRAVSASSSMSDADASGTVQPGELPFAALDGRRHTAWAANLGAGGAAWWEVTFTAARDVGSVRVVAGPSAQVVRVITAHHSSEAVDIPAGGARSIDIGDSSARWLRVVDASGRTGLQMSLAEVHVPGLRAHRRLVLPSTPSRWGDPDVIVLRASSDARTGCVRIQVTVDCVPGREVTGEEDLDLRREFQLPSATTARPSFQVRGRPGGSLKRLATKGLFATVSASSRAVPDMRASALAAVDGDPGTTWTAALDDLRPSIELRWLGTRRISAVRLRVDPDADARPPSRVRLVWGDGQRIVNVGPGGLARFPAVRTDHLRLEVLQAEPASSLGFGGEASPVQVGISEMRVRGVPFFPIHLSVVPVVYPCGSGPDIVVNGQRVQTSVEASPAQLYYGAVVNGHLCGARRLSLSSGLNVVALLASHSFTPSSLVLTSRPLGSADVQPTPSVQRTRVSATLSPAGPSTALTVPWNANAGWRAVQSGHQLSPMTVDGWKQGWRSQGGGRVSVTFGPDGLYRAGLLVGLLLLLALLVICVVPQRRWPGADAPALDDAAVPVALLLAVAWLGGGVLAAWPGLVFAVAGSLAAFRFARADAYRWAGAALVLPAAVAYAVRPWGSGQTWAGSYTWPHYLVVVVTAALLGWVAADLGRSLRFFSRRHGRSTNR